LRLATIHTVMRAKLGIAADNHGNEAALRAVLNNAQRLYVNQWQAPGDLILIGPRPAEVLEPFCKDCPASACSPATPIATS
jgi:hypothetical protein